MKAIQGLPPDRTILRPNGQLADGWWLFFDWVNRTLRAALTAANITVADIPASVRAPTTQSAPTRALNVVYQNTGATPMMVTVSIVLIRAGGVQATAQVRSDSATPPTTVIATTTTATAWTADGLQNYPMSFWVIPGNYYTVVTTGTATLASWIEWT